MSDNKHLFIIGVFLLSVISVNSIWAKGSRDENGLKQEDYDANGWYRKGDGSWVKNPNGAIFEEKIEYSKNIGISASVPVEGHIISAQQENNGANRFNQAENPGAHGFAAEQANTVDDLLHGRNARIVGDDNTKDGADRIVNGVRIQTKYWKSYQESVDSCFYTDSSGKYQFRYYNADGKPMPIEVPKDQYLDCIKQMEDRIREGSVPGISDPADAKNIVRKGSITYKQSINIGKAGTIDSLIYDAKTGIISCGFAFGISAAFDYGWAILNGIEPDKALKSAIFTGLKTGGITFVSAVLAGQITKMGFNPLPASTKVNTDWKTNNNIPGPFGKQSFEKLLRGNLIYAFTTVFVLTGVDTVQLFRGKISGSQLFKNLLTNSGAAAGAAGGAALGAKIGTAINPGMGTAIGTGIGGIAGGIVGGSIVNTAAGVFIEDDAVKMVEIIEGQFIYLTQSYILTQSEADTAVKVLETQLSDGKKLQNMFENDNRTLFARNLLTPIFEDIVRNRPFIPMPTGKQISDVLDEIIEEMAG